MIPYFKIPSLKLFGPLELQPFGVLVAVGILVGSWFAQKRALQEKIDLGEIRNGVAWAVVAGFIGAHWAAVLLYFPERISEEGIIVLFKFWSGISSFGGFFGAIAGLFIYYGLVRRKPWLHLAEIIVQALVIGWIFGRLACTVAYDHPGQVTDFFLGQEYKDGFVRHNLGFYEFLYTLFVILPASLVIYARKPRRGVVLGAIALVYAPIRYVLDTLRALPTGDARGQELADLVAQGYLAGADRRYLGLTPGQYFAIALVLVGLFMLFRSRSQDRIGDENVDSVSDEENAAKAAGKTKSDAKSSPKSGSAPSHQRNRGKGKAKKRHR